MTGEMGGGQSDWKGPGPITGGVSVHSWDGVRFQSLIRSMPP